MVRHWFRTMTQAAAAVLLIGAGYACGHESLRVADATGVTTATPVAADAGPVDLNPPANRPSADEVLAELLAGNERFTSGQATGPHRSPEDVRATANGQSPLAVVVTCADSRVPPVLLFDMGVGDLFVVRVAGNVVDGAGAPIQGSIEYAVAELHVPLIVVLGHTNCGAVKAAVEHLDGHESLPGS